MDLPFLAVGVAWLVVIDVGEDVTERVLGACSYVKQRWDHGRPRVRIVEVEKQRRRDRVSVVAVATKEGDR